MNCLRKKAIIFVIFLSFLCLCSSVCVNAEEETAPSFLIQREDLDQKFTYLKSKRSSFDTEKYHYENYYWRTNLGDTILLKLNYAGEIIDAFQDHPSWEGVANEKIVFVFSWFFNAIDRQVKGISFKEPNEIVEVLDSDESKGRLTESYKLGPFILDWNVTAKGGQGKYSAEYYTGLRDAINDLLMQDKLKQSAHDLIAKKVFKEERKKELITQVNKLVLSERLSFSKVRESLRKKGHAFPRSGKAIVVIGVIVGLIAALYFGMTYFMKKD